MRPRAPRPVPLLAAALAAAALLAPAAGIRAAEARRKAPSPPTPYASFRYLVRWRSGTNPVAGFARAVVSSPAPASRNPAPTPGKALRALPKPTDLALENGLSVNAAFVAWIGAQANALPETIVLDEADEAGHVATTKTFAHCRPVESQALADLDANASATRIAHLLLRCNP